MTNLNPHNETEAARIQPWILPNDSASLNDGRWVECCWDDLKRRWESGQCPRIEELVSHDVLNGLPHDVAVDLIYAEFAIRSDFGEVPDPDEFIRRFPRNATSLKRQFSLDCAVARMSSDSVALDETIVNQAGDTNGGPRETIDVPAAIGKYKIMRRLGAGAQSSVFLAWHPDLSKTVVIKLGHLIGAEVPEAYERFLLEARTLASLNHPHLIKVHDLDVFQGRAYLVMDSVRGRTLDVWLRDERPTSPRIATLFEKLAQGVAAAHRAGILHLDIKPNNILVDEQGEPHLIDFGLARSCDAWERGSDTDFGITGTFLYMSPEQASGALGKLTAQADIFGLGATLYHALTGKPPYSVDSLDRIRQKVRAGDWDTVALQHSTVAPQLKSVCRRALEVDPAARYATMEELAAALRTRRMSTATVMASIVATVAVAILLVSLASNLRKPAAVLPENTASAAPSETETPIPAVAPMKVSVWDKTADRYLDLVSSVPMKNGDEVKIELEIPPGTHALLLVLTSEGGLRELSRLSPATHLQQLRFPAATESAAPLTGNPGSEVLLLFASNTGEISTESLRQLPALMQAWSEIPDLTVIRATSEGVSFLQRDKDFGASVGRKDPVEQTVSQLEELRRHAASKRLHFEALVFGHR
jgi:serine/threonine protein kinase